MPFLELIDVAKSFGTTVAVDAFNLQAEQGEFVSFLGPSGCGKTTTLRMIAGFEIPTGGTIRANDADITRQPPNKRNVGMVFQSYALFPNMTVAQNIAFSLKVSKRPVDEIKRRVTEMLEMIHMPALGGRYPQQLSGGQQQRVALARALAMQPQLLLLDEPLSALDAKIRVSLRNEIRSIQRQLGITTVYVTHDQEEALSLSDRVVVMNAGRIEQIGTALEVYNYPKTAFVAQFVGTLNILNAHIADAAQSRVLIEQQVVQASASLEGYTPGQAISIAIRPERIRFLSGTAATNVLQGTVESFSFLGSIVRIQVRIGESNSFYLDEFNNPNLALPPPGTRVQVTFPAEAVLVLKR
jgi:putative spermidine/putrescine transport system ATP-binding protein